MEKNLSWPSINEWIKNMCFIYTMDYYSVIKMNEILPLEAIWMDLEGIMLSQINQVKKNKYCVILLMCGI